jgi:hypothetical protein
MKKFTLRISFILILFILFIFLISGCSTILNKKIKSCNNLKDSQTDKCLLDLALKKENPLICNEIINDLTRRDNCYIQLAEFLDDANICQGVESRDRKIDCYYKLIDDKEELYCKTIENKFYANICEMQVANAKLYKD